MGYDFPASSAPSGSTASDQFSERTTSSTAEESIEEVLRKVDEGLIDKAVRGGSPVTGQEMTVAWNAQLRAPDTIGIGGGTSVTYGSWPTQRIAGELDAHESSGNRGDGKINPDGGQNSSLTGKEAY